MIGIMILILTVEAVRIGIYLKFFSICISSHRGNHKIAGIILAVLWLCKVGLYIAAGAQYAVFVLIMMYPIEILFLFIISFFYRGKTGWKILLSILLPFFYGCADLVISYLLFHTIPYTDKQYLICTGITTGLLALLLVLLGRIRKTKQEREQEVLRLEIEMYEKQFELIRQTQNEVRSLKHDLKHHMKMLSDMAGEGDNEGIQQYLQNMGAFMEHGEAYISTGNERIDSVLNYMIAKAKTAGVKTDWRICIPEQLEISAFDMNVILSNLLENALNELQKVDTPTLSIRIKYDRGILYICIQNDAGGGNEVWKKEPSLEHGYGLKNVSKIIEKYHGNLEIIKSKGKFEANVLLFLGKPERD